jgi:ribosomal protein S18 acetylase RimI-like enzyme
MALLVRPARPQDLPAAQALCARRVLHDSLFMNAERFRAYTLEHLSNNFARLEAAHEEGRILVAERDGEVVAYVVLLLRTKETITLEMQTLIFDCCVFEFEALAAFLPSMQEIGKNAGDRYLVAHLQQAAKREQLWFYRLGFRPEQNRVVKHIAQGTVGPSHAAYRVRRARKNEHLFIIRVNAEYSALYRPAGRDTDLQTVRTSFFGAYVSLDLAEPSMHYLILEERATKLPAGYIILVEHEMPPGVGPAFYTYDVAVAPEFAGRGLSLYLCGAAETLVGKRGGLIFGDTSLDNKAAVNGDKYLGFHIDSQRWGLRL